MDTSLLRWILIFVFLPIIGFSQMPSTPNSPYTVRWYQVSQNPNSTGESMDSIVSQYALHNHINDVLNQYWLPDAEGIYYSVKRVGIGGIPHKDYELMLTGIYGLRQVGATITNQYYTDPITWQELYNSTSYKFERIGGTYYLINSSGFGINNLTPDVALDVTGSAEVSGTMSVATSILGNHNYGFVMRNSSNGQYYHLPLDSIYANNFDSTRWWNTGHYYYPKDYGAYIGIGINTPDELIHIRDTANTYFKATAIGTTAVAGSMYQNDDQIWTSRIRGDIDDQYEIYDATNSKIPFSIQKGSPTYTLRIYADSSTQVYDFKVTDSVEFIGLKEQASATKFVTQDANKVLGWRDDIVTNPGGILSDLTDGYGIVTFTYNGSSVQYVIVDTAELRTWISGGFTFGDTCYFDKTGNYIYPKAYATDMLGLGTMTPTEKLDVNGNINIPTTTSVIGQLKQNGSTIFHTYGTENMFFGLANGTFDNYTYYNIGIGSHVFDSLDYGNQNIAIGSLALNAVESGSDNIAIGVTSQQSNVSGIWNNSIGSGTLINITSGTHNNVMGGDAMQDNTDGMHNSAIGDNALLNNISGNFNSTLGSQSLIANTGHRNSALGYKAGNNITAENRNITIGDSTEIFIGSGDGQINIGDVYRGFRTTHIARIDSALLIVPKSIAPTPTEGLLYYDSDLDTLYVYANGTWQSLNGGGGGSGTTETASNRNTLGWYSRKVVNDLQFRGIKSTDGYIDFLDSTTYIGLTLDTANLYDGIIFPNTDSSVFATRYWVNFNYADSVNDLKDVILTTPDVNDVLMLDDFGVWRNYDQSWLSSEVDGDVTNEGSLSVVDGSNVIDLVSNTVSSTNVTFVGGSNITIDAVGSTITITSTASGADNLGNHIMTDELETSGHWISYSGNEDGIYVDDNDYVGINTSSTTQELTVGGDVSVTDTLGATYLSISNSGEIGDDFQVNDTTTLGDYLQCLENAYVDDTMNVKGAITVNDRILTLPTIDSTWSGTAIYLPFDQSSETDDINRGDLIFMNTSGRVQKCDADAASTMGYPYMALEKKTTGSGNILVLVEGFYRYTLWNITSIDDGLPLYVSTTFGKMEVSAPTGNADVSRIVGSVVNAANEVIHFNPDQTFIIIYAP